MNPDTPVTVAILKAELANLREEMRMEIRENGEKITRDILSFVENIVIDIHVKIDLLSERVKIIEREIIDIKKDISILKNDMEIMKKDISILKRDMEVMKKEVSEIKIELETMNETIASQQIDLAIALRYKATLHNHEKRIGSLEKKVN